MNLDFLQNAFKELNFLTEDTFDVTDKGIAGLTALKASNDENSDISVIDPDATKESDLANSYVGKIIMECPVCHSFVFYDRDAIEIDIGNHLANITTECPYCCEVGGFNIIGEVQDFNAEDSNDEDEVSEEAEEVETQEEPEEDAEEVDEEDASDDSDDAENSDEGSDSEEDEVVEELQQTEDTVNESEEISDEPKSECVGPECESACKDECALTDAVKTVTNDMEHKIEFVLNNELGIDSWTSYSYDDEDETSPVEVYNAKELVGKFFIVDGKLIDSENNDNGNDADKSEKEDEALSEDLTVNADEDKTVVSDGEKEITITDACPNCAHDDSADEVEDSANVTEVEASAEEKSEEKIVPMTDTDKEEILSGEAKESSKDSPEGDTEVDVDVDEIEEEAFDTLGTNYLKKTYENVDSYKTLSATSNGEQIKLEGVITFKSGKTKNTTFVFEAKDISKTGKARFIGENANICKGKKAFTISGSLKDGKFITESLNYNYNTKDVDGKSTRVYGTVSNKRV